MDVLTLLTLLALPNDVAVQYDGFSPRCGACHANHVDRYNNLLRDQVGRHGVHVWDDVTRRFGDHPTAAPLTCWGCNIKLRGLNDLNPV